MASNTDDLMQELNSVNDGDINENDIAWDEMYGDPDDEPLAEPSEPLTNNGNTGKTNGEQEVETVVESPDIDTEQLESLMEQNNVQDASFEPIGGNSATDSKENGAMEGQSHNDQTVDLTAEAMIYLVAKPDVAGQLLKIYDEAIAFKSNNKEFSPEAANNLKIMCCRGILKSAIAVAKDSVQNYPNVAQAIASTGSTVDQLNDNAHKIDTVVDIVKGKLADSYNMTQVKGMGPDLGQTIETAIANYDSAMQSDAMEQTRKELEDFENAKREAEEEEENDRKRLENGDVAGKTVENPTDDSEEEDAGLEALIEETITKIFQVYRLVYKPLFQDPPVGVMCFKCKEVNGVCEVIDNDPEVICCGSSGKKTDSADLRHLSSYNYTLAPIYGDIVKHYSGLIRQAPYVGSHEMGISTSWMDSDGRMKYNYAPYIQVRNCTGVYLDKESGRLVRESRWSMFEPKLMAELRTAIKTMFKKVKNDYESRCRASASLVDIYTTIFVANKFDTKTAMDFTIYSSAINEADEGAKLSSIISGHPLLKRGKRSTIQNDSNDNGIRRILIISDKEKYKKEVSFAYKTVGKLLLSGGKVDLSNAIIGTDMSGNPVGINLQASNHVTESIIAQTRSGKGVLTLVILAYIIASKCPFMYIDYKPDMAATLWDMEKKHNAKIFAIDGQVGYTKGSIPTRYYSFKGTYPNELTGSIGSSIQCLAYAKGVVLMCLIAALRQSGKLEIGNPVFFILDEAQAASLAISELKKIIRSLTTTGKTDGNPNPATYAKKKGEPESNEHIRDYLSKLNTFLNCDGVGAYCTTNGGKGRVSAILIGQGTYAENWAYPFNRLLELSSGSVRFMGSGTEKQSSGGGKFGMYSRSKGLNGIDLVGLGYFGVENAEGNPSLQMVKTLMVLNEADYNVSTGEVGHFCQGVLDNLGDETLREEMKQHEFTVDEENDIAKEYGLSVGEENKLIGFDDLVMFIANHSSGSFDLKYSLESGYRMVYKVLNEIGLVGDNDEPYPNVERYIYSAREDSLFTCDQMYDAYGSGKNIFEFTGIKKGDRLDATCDVVGGNKNVTETPDGEVLMMGASSGESPSTPQEPQPQQNPQQPQGVQQPTAPIGQPTGQSVTSNQAAPSTPLFGTTSTEQTGQTGQQAPQPQPQTVQNGAQQVNAQAAQQQRQPQNQQGNQHVPDLSGHNQDTVNWLNNLNNLQSPLPSLKESDKSGAGSLEVLNLPGRKKYADGTYGNDATTKAYYDRFLKSLIEYPDRIIDSWMQGNKSGVARRLGNYAFLCLNPMQYCSPLTKEGYNDLIRTMKEGIASTGRDEYKVITGMLEDYASGQLQLDTVPSEEKKKDYIAKYTKQSQQAQQAQQAQGTQVVDDDDEVVNFGENPGTPNTPNGAPQQAQGQPQQASDQTQDQPQDQPGQQEQQGEPQQPQQAQQQGQQDISDSALDNVNTDQEASELERQQQQYSGVEVEDTPQQPAWQRGDNGDIILDNLRDTSPVYRFNRDTYSEVMTPKHATMERFKKFLFESKNGTQYEFKKRWEYVLDTIAKDIGDRARVRLVQFTPFWVVANNRSFEFGDLIGDEEFIAAVDIINVHKTFKEFPMIETVKFDETTVECLIDEYGGSAEEVWNIFRENRSLQHLCIFKGGQEYKFNRRTFAQTKDQFAKLLNIEVNKMLLDQFAATKNKRVEEKSAGYRTKAENRSSGKGVATKVGQTLAKMKPSKPFIKKAAITTGAVVLAGAVIGIPTMIALGVTGAFGFFKGATRS